jgi:hypothetical protein
MKFTIKSEAPANIMSGCVLPGVFEHSTLSPAAAPFDKSTRTLLKTSPVRRVTYGTASSTMIRSGSKSSGQEIRVNLSLPK